MTYTAGIDIGSTYTKAIILDADYNIVGKSMEPTGFKLTEVAETTFNEAIRRADLEPRDVAYTVATGFGRHQALFSDV